MFYSVLGSIVLATLLPYFIGDIWVLDLLDQARIQLSMLYFLLLLFCLIAKRWIAAGSLLVVLLINCLIVSYPYWKNKNYVSNNPLHSPIRVLSFNINANNTNLDSINSLINSIRPDIIFLMEVNASIFKELTFGLDERYPFRLEERKKHHPEYIAVFSNLPFSQMDLTESVIGKDFKIAKVTFEQNDLRLHFFGIHPVSPRSQERLIFRNYQFSHIANHIARYSNGTDYIIVAGDMNTAPWSQAFNRFLSTTGLMIANDLTNINLSWPSALPYPLRIPIDHVLVSSNFCRLNSFTVLTSKSDHAAIVADMTFC